MMLIFELWLKNVVDSHERKGDVFFFFSFLFLTSKIIYQEIIVCAFLSKMFKAQVSVPQ